MVSLTILFPATQVLSAGEQDQNNVRLVLQITVDGLRRDMLDRYQPRFSRGGFRHLLDSGVFFTNNQKMNFMVTNILVYEKNSE